MNSSMCRNLALIALFLTSQIIQATAQRLARTPGTAESHASPIHLEPDTLLLTLVDMKDPAAILPYEDTLLNSFHEFDVSHLWGTSYFNLGFPGSAIRPIIPLGKTFTGFRLGLDQFDPYRKDEHNFHFFRLKKAFTYANYTQGRSQEEGIIRTLFSRDFKDGINLSLDYNRYNNMGVYNHQKIQNTNLGVGLWIRSKDEKLHVFLNHFSNVFDQDENGGITTDTLFNSPFFEQRITIPVYLQSADTRDQERTYQMLAQYQLTGVDSLARADGLTAQYQIRISNRRYRFSDTDPPSENDYYDGFFTDSRGLRQFIRHQQLTNAARLQFRGKLDGQLISVGLRNVIHKIEQEPLTETIAEWFGDGSIQWKFGDRVRLVSVGEIAVNSNNASFLISGDLDLDLGIAGRLLGNLTINRRNPTLIQRRLFVSQTNIWDHDLDNLTINRIEATYIPPKLGLHITAGQQLISNPIFFDHSAFPRQLDEVVSLSYLKVTNRIRFGNIYSENKIVLQTAGNQEVYRIPRWYSEHRLYFLGPLFKDVLNLNIGFDYRMNSPYDGITYYPLTGQFTNEDDFEVPFFPYVDFRIGFRVKYFRAFFMLHNVLKPIRNDVYFQTSRYPSEDLHLRIGLGWAFIN